MFSIRQLSVATLALTALIAITSTQPAQQPLRPWPAMSRSTEILRAANRRLFVHRSAVRPRFAIATRLVAAPAAILVRPRFKPC